MKSVIQILVTDFFSSLSPLSPFILSLASSFILLASSLWCSCLFSSAVISVWKKYCLKMIYKYHTRYMLGLINTMTERPWNKLICNVFIGPVLLTLVRLSRTAFLCPLPRRTGSSSFSSSSSTSSGSLRKIQTCLIFFCLVVSRDAGEPCIMN